MTTQVELSIRELLDASRADRASVGFELPDQVLLFHIQQAIEKLLKVLIAAHGELFPFTHNLEKLLSALHGLGETVVLDSWLVLLLNAAAVEWRYRYPDALTAEQRDACRKAMDQVHTFVYKRLAMLHPDVDWTASTIP